MYEVVSADAPEVGIFRDTLADALAIVGRDEQIWQVADDEQRTRLCLIPREVEPGMRRVGREWLYSAAWL